MDFTYKSYVAVEALVKQAFENNWFKIFTPKNLGGLECSLPEGLKILVKSAQIDPSLGWVVNLGSGAGFFWSYYSKKASEELMKSKDFVIAGSGRPNGTALRVSGGFLVSGTWPKCSGAAHASHFTVNARDEEGQVKSFTFRRTDVKIIDDWTYFGLKSTSSYSITCQNVFVPADYVFEIGKILQPEHPYRIHQLPFPTFAKYCIHATFCGIAGFFIHLVSIDQTLKERIGANLIDKYENTISDYYECLLSLAELDWNECIKVDTLPIFNNRSTLELTRFVERINALTSEVYFRGGMRMADSREPVNQAFCDLLTAIHHSYLK